LPVELFLPVPANACARAHYCLSARRQPNLGEQQLDGWCLDSSSNCASRLLFGHDHHQFVARRATPRRASVAVPASNLLHPARSRGDFISSALLLPSPQKQAAAQQNQADVKRVRVVAGDGHMFV